MTVDPAGTSAAEIETVVKEFIETLAQLEHAGASVSNPVEVFAGIMTVRLPSNLQAISILLSTGHLDEAVVLIRRQVEDSLRLHYIWNHKNKADQLVAWFVRDRDNKVRKVLDRLINREDVSDDDKVQLRKALARRKRRVDEHDTHIAELGMEREQFPRIEDMAVELGRARDLVAYSSMSDVAHSAVSGSTDLYLARAGHQLAIRTTVFSPASSAIYARVAVTSTSLGVYFSLLLTGLDEEAGTVMEAGVRAENDLLSISARQISGPGGQDD